MGVSQQVMPVYLTGVISFNVAVAGQPGWLRMDGKTIGSGASGATARANGDTIALYRVLWDTYTNAQLPIQTSAGAPGARGASADADFLANKRLPLHSPDADFLRVLDSTGAIDAARAIGTHQAGQIPSHTHATPGHSANFVGDVINGEGLPGSLAVSVREVLPAVAIGGVENSSENRPPNTAWPVFIHL